MVAPLGTLRSVTHRDNVLAIVKLTSRMAARIRRSCSALCLEKTAESENYTSNFGRREFEANGFDRLQN
jgi:hypothetical protein